MGIVGNTCVVAILLAVLTVSPKTEYFGVFCPITPAGCNPTISIHENELLDKLGQKLIGKGHVIKS